MPVESADLEAAAKQYAATLREIAGSPPVLDLVTWVSARTATPLRWCRAIRCSMSPDADVAVTGVYQGRRRMTLTYPMLNRARRVLWVVTGSEKCKCCVACSMAMSRFRRAGFAANEAWCWPTGGGRRVNR